jgi:hypothetical protein
LCFFSLSAAIPLLLLHKVGMGLVNRSQRGDPLFFLTVSAVKESSSFAKLRLHPLPLFLKITLFNRFN